MAEVSTRSGRIHYTVSGDQNGGTPVLLLHGMGMAHTSYADVIEGLAAEKKVIAVDSPGHGQSETPADDGAFPVSRFAEATLDVLNGLNLDKVDIVGNSLGAMTAVEFAAAYPDRVRNLVLVGCPGWDDQQRSERAEARKKNPMQRPDPNVNSTAADLTPMFTAPSQAVVDRVNEARRQSAEFIVRAGEAVITHDTIGRSPGVKAPTLLLCGERDIVIPEQPGFLKNIKGSTMVVFDNAGHYPQVDNPDRFVRTVLEFLKS